MLGSKTTLDLLTLGNSIQPAVLNSAASTVGEKEG